MTTIESTYVCRESFQDFFRFDISRIILLTIRVRRKNRGPQFGERDPQIGTIKKIEIDAKPRSPLRF